MPFYRWLPAAMVAPTPVSALLHAVAVVKAGAFTVLKVLLYVFGTHTLTGMTDGLIGLAGVTVVAASFTALKSDNLKRRLAYSTISQLAYIVLAAAVLAPLSLVGAALRIGTKAASPVASSWAQTPVKRMTPPARWIIA